MSSEGIRLSGVASGIDTSGIIEAMLSPEREKIAGIEEDIELNDAKIDTWKDIASELQSFGKVLSNLKSDLSTSIYNQKTVSTTDDDVLTAVATNQAVEASYPIKVNALAQSQVIGFESGYTWDDDSTLVKDLTFYINDSSEITIAEGATLDEVVDAINSASYADESERVTATKIKTSISEPNEYTMVLQGASSKSTINLYSNADGDHPLSGSNEFGVFTGSESTSGNEKNLPFFTSSGGVWDTPVNIVRQKQDASLTLFYSDVDSDAGITVTSYTNQFADAIPGISVTVNQTGESTIEVKSDTAEIKEAITEFVSSYNDVKGMLDRVREVKLDEDDRFGPFFSDALLRRISSQIRSLTTGIVRMGSESNWASEGNITVKSIDGSSVTLENFSSDEGTKLASGDRVTIGSTIYTLTTGTTINASGEATVSLSPSPADDPPDVGAGVFLQTQTLESIGVGVQTDGVSALEGKLAILDEGALDAALSNSLTDVQDIFRRDGSVSSDTGVAQRLYDWVNQQTFLSFAVSSAGQSLINKRAIDDVKLSALETSNTNLENQIERIEERIAQREKVLVQQFSRMEAAMSQSQSMTGALGSLNAG